MPIDLSPMLCFRKPKAVHSENTKRQGLQAFEETSKLRPLNLKN